MAKTSLSPPAWKGREERLGWIGSLAASDVATAHKLLDRAEEALREAGMEQVSFGGDPAHIYPGPPEEEEWLIEVLRQRGYRFGEAVYDFYAPIADLRVRLLHPEARPARPSDVARLLEFLEKEFPGRWAAETEQRLRVEDDPSFVVLIAKGSEIVAFTHASTLQHRHLASNLNFHLALGQNPGGIGHVGVAKAHRGKGLGRAVVEAGIEVLRAAGVTGICVDWSGLVQFYCRLGFQVRTPYLMCRKSLAE